MESGKQLLYPCRLSDMNIHVHVSRITLLFIKSDEMSNREGQKSSPFQPFQNVQNFCFMQVNKKNNDFKYCPIYESLINSALLKHLPELNTYLGI